MPPQCELPNGLADWSGDRILVVNPFGYESAEDLTTFLRAHCRNADVKGVMFEEAPEEQAGRGLAACLERIRPWAEHKPGAVVFGLSARLDASGTALTPELLSILPKTGLKMIQWTWPDTRVVVPVELLLQLSKQGIWNHVRGPDLFKALGKTDIGRFIADHPHIVHSFQDGSMAGLEAGMSNLPVYADTYARVAPLPGRPGWTLLADPVQILVCLTHYSQEEFSRLRWDGKTRTWLRLGDAVSWHYHPSRDLPPGFLDEICRMVEAGGSVDLTYVRMNLERAYLIGYAVEHGVIVGTSSLKHPRDEFIQRLQARTGIDFSRFVERGYTSVRPEYRSMGVGRQLLQGLTDRAGKHKVFSIIDEDNLATQKMARSNRTRKITSYYSPELGKTMGVWMPEEMIADLPSSTGHAEG